MIENEKHRLIAGQRSLFEKELGERPVTYCRVCRLRLRSPKSIDSGVGPICSRRERSVTKNQESEHGNGNGSPTAG